MADTEQPRGARPDEYLPRTDAGARVLVGRMDQQNKAIAELHSELDDLRTEVRGYREHTVTHKGMIGWVGVAAVVIVSASWAVTTRSVDQAEKVGTKAETAVASLKTEVAANKTHADAQTIEVRKDLQALYQFLATRRKQSRLEMALEEP